MLVLAGFLMIYLLEEVVHLWLQLAGHLESPQKADHTDQAQVKYMETW